MSEENSVILSLPYILPAQAQKHVTHNEALRMLDLLVQLAVTSRALTAPPSTPTDGLRYIVPSGATGEFAGHIGEIALWHDGQWHFFQPQPGWQAEVLDEATRVVFDGATWIGPEAQTHQVMGLGVGTQPDATNRLAVAADATLLTHDGGGHQLKINKAAATDTASLLFQTGWSGRAEMGIAGSDAFEIKASADGATFHTALRALPASGRVELPSGSAIAAGNAATPGLAFLGDEDTGLFHPDANVLALSTGGMERARVSSAGMQVTGLITGTAVTQGTTDTMAGRLMKVGDFGLGMATTTAPLYPNWTSITQPSGTYAFSAATLNSAERPPGFSAGNFGILKLDRYNAERFTITAWRSSPGLEHNIWRRDFTTGTFGPWYRAGGAIVGAVGQSGGIPTGAVIERGSNANGSFVRYADGTQICWNAFVTSASESSIWTYSAAFVFGDLPVVTISCANTAGPSPVIPNLAGAPTATTVSLNLWSLSATRVSLNARVMAIGRWF